MLYIVLAAQATSPSTLRWILGTMVGTRFRVLAIVVLCSGGSQAVDRWEVDNAFITLQGGQPVVATSTILAIINCSLFAALRAAAALPSLLHAT